VAKCNKFNLWKTLCTWFSTLSSSLANPLEFLAITKLGAVTNIHSNNTTLCCRVPGRNSEMFSVLPSLIAKQ